MFSLKLYAVFNRKAESGLHLLIGRLYPPQLTFTRPYMSRNQSRREESVCRNQRDNILPNLLRQLPMNVAPLCVPLFSYEKEPLPAALFLPELANLPLLLRIVVGLVGFSLVLDDEDSPVVLCGRYACHQPIVRSFSIHLSINCVAVGCRKCVRKRCSLPLKSGLNPAF